MITCGNLNCQNDAFHIIHIKFDKKHSEVKYRCTNCGNAYTDAFHTQIYGVKK